MSIKNSNKTIGNQTRDLPACSAVPQPAALPGAPRFPHHPGQKSPVLGWNWYNLYVIITVNKTARRQFKSCFGRLNHVLVVTEKAAFTNKQDIGRSPLYDRRKVAFARRFAGTGQQNFIKYVQVVFVSGAGIKASELHVSTTCDVTINKQHGATKSSLLTCNCSSGNPCAGQASERAALFALHVLIYSARNFS